MRDANGEIVPGAICPKTNLGMTQEEMGDMIGWANWDSPALTNWDDFRYEFALKHYKGDVNKAISDYAEHMEKVKRF